MIIKIKKGLQKENRKEAKKGAGQMSFERAKEYLKHYGLEERIMEFSVSSATVSEAAAAIGCYEAEIAKTLSFLVADQPILIVAAGDARIENGKFKAEFHTKAKMIPFASVEELIGHAVGGVCPFGVHPEVRIFLDRSLQRFEHIYPACGSANSAVKLTVLELKHITDYQKWVDVCKDA